jgi:hypothetical protein
MLVRRDIDGTRSEARLTPGDVARLRARLENVPGGYADSPAAKETLDVLDAASGAESQEVDLAPSQSAAMHWALEQMMAEDEALSQGLSDLRAVVVPVVD